jgi:PIF1-like helicase
MDVICDSETCMDCAILRLFNEYVDQFNSEVLGWLPGETHSHFSVDWIKEDGQDITDNLIATPDFLNSLNKTGISPHQLILKVGTICCFTRNFHASCRLTKNTQVIV